MVWRDFSLQNPSKSPGNGIACPTSEQAFAIFLAPLGSAFRGRPLTRTLSLSGRRQLHPCRILFRRLQHSFDELYSFHPLLPTWYQQGDPSRPTPLIPPPTLSPQTSI